MINTIVIIFIQIETKNDSRDTLVITQLIVIVPQGSCDPPVLDAASDCRGPGRRMKLSKWRFSGTGPGSSAFTIG